MDDTTALALARAVRRRRRELGYTQRQLAAEMTTAGLPGWTGATVANMERTDKPPRALSVAELAGLCVALRCSLDDLLAGAPQVAERLRGASWEARTRSWAVQVNLARRAEHLAELERRLSSSLGRADVAMAAEELYGRDVLAERDARLEDAPPGDPRNRAKRLGHATRAIRDELSHYFDEQYDLPGPGL